MTQLLRISQVNQQHEAAYARVFGPVEGNTPWHRLDSHLQFSIGGGAHDVAMVMLTIDDPYGKSTRQSPPHDARTINVEQISPGLESEWFAGAHLYLANGSQCPTGKVKELSLGWVDGMNGDMFGLIDGKPGKRHKAFFSFALSNDNPTAVVILSSDGGVYKPKENDNANV